MVSMLESRSSGLGEPWPGTLCCVLGLSRHFYSHGASLHAGVQMDTPEFNAGGNPAMDYPEASHPRGVEILLVASCTGTGISSSLMRHLACMQT